MSAQEREKQSKPWPAIYTWVWPMVVAAGRRKGYAMAIHGSMQRDLDVIAAPWTEDASSEVELIEEIAEAVQIYLPDGVEMLTTADRQRGGPSEKPHGRRGWSLHMGGGAYIDLSIMPLRPTQENDR